MVQMERERSRDANEIFKQKQVNNGRGGVSVNRPPAAVTYEPPSVSIEESQPAFEFPWQQSPALQARESWTRSFPARLSPSPQRSPLRQSKPDFENTPTGGDDKDGEGQNLPNKEKGIATWFKGSSAPFALGVSVTPEAAMDHTNASSSSPTRGHRKAASVSHMKQSPASSSRFSFFSMASKRVEEDVSAGKADDDELVNMDIYSALFPSGVVDPFSPSSFKNLQMNAEGALLKLHAGYKAQNAALRKKSMGYEQMTEDLEEAETRARHLKMQLDNMAVQAAEQERAMKELADKFDREREARQIEEEARLRSVLLVSKPPTLCQDEHSEDEECDLGAWRERPKRPSRTNTVATDSGFESEGESSVVDSIFSRSRSASSPTGTMFSSSTKITSPDSYHVDSRAQSPCKPAFQDITNKTLPQRPAPVPRQSTFQRVLKSLRADQNTVQELDIHKLGYNSSSEEGCTPTRTAPPSSTSSIQAENEALRERVAQLESTLDSCLGLVGSA